MQIEAINIYQISLPFTGQFPHHQSEGKSARNIICEVVADQGAICGYGEGAPRDFVTGETQQSASTDISYFVKSRLFPSRLEHVSQIWEFADTIEDIDNHQSAFCALEMALLDAIGKKQQQYLTAYFSQAFFTDTVQYGAIIPLLDPENTRRLCRRICENGIRRIKLKMGDELSRNRMNLEIIRDTFQDGYDLKVDVNSAWNEQIAIENLSLIQEFNIRVVEQPLPRGQAGGAAVSKHFSAAGVFLMADESACSLEDVTRIVADKDYTMINIRLSKCGGFRKSIQMIEILRKADIPFQIGCHLGESGVLSAAGRVLSLLNEDAVYHDGSYDAFILQENITRENVIFGEGGIAGRLKGSGLGVEISHSQLKRLSTSMTRVTPP